MREAKNITTVECSKKYVDKIRESLIKKNPDENKNNEEIEFLLKRL